MTLGLDVTESTIRAVVVNDGAQILARAEQRVTVSGLEQAIREVVRRARGAAGRDLSGAGVATPTPDEIVPSDVVTAFAEALPGIHAKSIASGMAAALAETWCGAARGLRDVVTFAIGEHVTSGMMLGGEIWTGAHGRAGSVGYLALNPVEREDYRKFGGLEAEVGSAGIVRRLVWRLKSGDQSALAEQVGRDFARLSVEMVLQGARDGDGVCISVVRDTARYVGMAVANLATMIDPEAIVLGGTLASAGDVMLEAIRSECSRRLHPAQADRVRIILSTLGADAVPIGAARAAALTSA
jgi:glucokinase